MSSGSEAHLIWFVLACSEVDSGEETAVVAVPLDERVALGEVQRCESPVATPTYTESGGPWGLLDGESQAVGHEESPSLGIADATGDGLLEVLVLQQLGNSYIYTHRGTAFTADRPKWLGVGTSAVFADADNSGALDLIVGGLTPFIVKDLNQSPVFITGIPAVDERAPLTVHDFAPGDIDGDGHLDFYVPLTRDQHGGADYNDVVLRFEGSSIVVDAEVVPEAAGVAHGFDATWFDEDGDGDLDVYVANDLGSVMGPSTLLRNEGGILVDAAESCFCSLMTNNKGVDVGDVNRDGLPDLYVTGNPANTLLRQLADGTWVDVTTVTKAGGVDAGVTGWGGNFVDYDNDGWLDLLSAQGDRWNPGNDNQRIDVQPRLFRQVDGVFEDVSAEVGVAGLGSFRAAASLDFNADGVEDFLVTQIEGRPLLFLSDSCTEAGWLEVTAPLGSRVEIDVGGSTQAAWVRGDEGYLANGPPRVHFGLGAAEAVEAMRVFLPGGERLETGPFEGRRQVTVVAQ